MPAGGQIKLDKLLAELFDKKEGDIITGMQLSGGVWTYIKKNGLQIKSEKKK